MDSLVPLMDAMEKREREVATAAGALLRAADLDIRAGEYERAAALIRAVIELYRATHVEPYRIPEYEKRLADCNSLKRLKPGRGRR